MEKDAGGIILIDKPKGISSFDVIRRLRRELNMKKMGHAGTLDPNASGLLIIGVGKDTKRLAQLVKLPKTYEAEIVLGESRISGDITGEIIDECVVSGLDEQTIREALAEMIGTLEIAAPIYSAIKQGGEPLYKKARRGEKVEPPMRRMEVRAATLLNIEPTDNRLHVSVSFDVGSGTYIRSLAEELGRRLGLPATLANLRRTQIGDFSIHDARPLASS